MNINIQSSVLIEDNCKWKYVNTKLIGLNRELVVLLTRIVSHLILKVDFKSTILLIQNQPFEDLWIAMH